MISLLYKNPKPRTFTAKTLSTLRSSIQVRIDCLPLRLRGENAFKRVRTKRSSRHLATLISRLRKHTARKQTVAYASGSERHYASGKVTPNFNQSWKNHDVFLSMLLLDLFRQSEPFLTKLMIDVQSNGLISSQGLKQSLNHDVNFLNIRLG